MADMDFVCADLAHGISALYRVSMLIQRPVAPDRLDKYTKFPVSHYVDYERRLLERKYPRLRAADSEIGGGFRTFLGGRLVQANLKRRQIFMYAASHHKKIATTEYGRQISTSGKPQSPKEPAVRQLQHEEIEPSKGVQTAPKASSIGISDALYKLTNRTRSETTATVYVEPHFDVEKGPYSLLRPIPQALSEYSSSQAGSSVVSVGEADDNLPRVQYCIPQRPKTLGPSGSGECPYCFKIIQVSSENRWR